MDRNKMEAKIMTDNEAILLIQNTRQQRTDEPTNGHTIVLNILINVNYHKPSYVQNGPNISSFGQTDGRTNIGKGKLDWKRYVNQSKENT